MSAETSLSLAAVATYVRDLPLLVAHADRVESLIADPVLAAGIERIPEVSASRRTLARVLATVDAGHARLTAKARALVGAL